MMPLAEMKKRTQRSLGDTGLLSILWVYDLTGIDKSTLVIGSANLNQCNSLMTKSPASPRMNGLL
jgi:hypothetical protein